MREGGLPAAARRSTKPRRTGSVAPDAEAGETSRTFLSARQTANFRPHGAVAASVTGEGREMAGEHAPEEEMEMMRPSEASTIALPVRRRMS